MIDLDLWPIGNCQVSALVDRSGRFVWGCVPRVDGDPLFSALLGGDQPETGYWSIELEDGVSVEQAYQRNTPILVSRHADAAGNAIEVVDFCPYFRRHGRKYHPVGFVRIVRPLAGSPRIRVRLRPACGWGAPCPRSAGSTTSPPAPRTPPARPSSSPRDIYINIDIGISMSGIQPEAVWIHPGVGDIVRARPHGRELSVRRNTLSPSRGDVPAAAAEA